MGSVESLVLASKSAARRAMLTQAGITFAVHVSNVDEDAIKNRAEPDQPAALAISLAEAKALAVSVQMPDRLVIGADQILSLGPERVSKARSLEDARARLATMRGCSHQLHSGAALAKNGVVLWSGVDTATLTMRNFSDGFLDHYLAVEGTGLLDCVGAYKLEGMGAQLFDRIEGDYFTVLGMPLWALLTQLREFGAIAT